jgi:alpha-glucosidase
MKHEIKNLYALTQKDETVVLQGEGGSVFIKKLAKDVFSVEYSFEWQSSNYSGNQSSASFHRYDADMNEPFTQKWDRIEETEKEYNFRSGQSRINVMKASGLVTVFRNDIRIFGGPIGNADTVLPKFPLRVQSAMADVEHSCKSARQPGKFNFRAEDEDIFLGLGEKTGSLDKSHRRFKMFNRDALGYNPEFSDPLYISIPFFMQINRERNTIAGVFFPDSGIDEVDFQVESNYYIAVALSNPPYSYIVFTGETYKEILDNYTKFEGRPTLPPRFAFGFFGSSMSYTDPPDAESRVLEYFRKIEQFGFPCEGMYFSSGYAKSENGERYTFIWNEKKFPNPKSFIGSLKDRGYKICCNVKPGILVGHPWYEEMKARNYFVPDSSGKELVEYYWGNYASFVDFTREAVREWWKSRLKMDFIDVGIEGIWNDNNEFEMEDESVPLFKRRKELPVLMSMASHEALCESKPGKRPWVISRAGYSGIQKFASTWTGDNVSDEKSMTFNIAMGMNLGLSGVPFYGHDIGGFFGPTPSSELLLRWCQSAVFQPRYIMHSWNPDGEPTEPWMYRELIDSIRSLIKIRYRFLPYIYSTAIEASLTGAPMERPLWLEYSNDSTLMLNSNAHLVGDSILVIPPESAGDHMVQWRFPPDNSWVSSDFRHVYEGDSTHECGYPDNEALFYFRSGAIISFNEDESKMPDGFPEYLDFLVIPLPVLAKQKTRTSHIFEDDGISAITSSSYNEFLCTQSINNDGSIKLMVKFEKISDSAPLRRGIRVWVPEGFRISISEPNAENSERIASGFLDAAGRTLEFVIAGKYSS